jgi:hypothetical protein
MNGEGVTAKLDPRLLRDVLALLKQQGETTISIMPEKVIRIDAKTKLDGVASLMSALM